MKKYILALDEGTTSARAILFDKKCNIVKMAQFEFPQIYPKPGWVEHDPLTIYARQMSAIAECVAKADIKNEEIAGIGITNQRETTVVWDKNTGKPIYNAIVWQCRRTTDICNNLISQGFSDYIQDTTGLKIDAYFSGTKIKWILDNVEGAREKANNGELLFGTIDTWLIWKLTDGKVHVTDRTNASRTMLYDINNNKWDDKILSILDIPNSMLPEVKSSSEIYGYVSNSGTQIPICGIAGDQQAALFGHGCFTKGEAKNTYGTGCFLLTNIGDKPIKSNAGLITTIAATEKDKPIEYALEGSVFVGGACMQWLRDELHLFFDTKDSEYFANKVESTNGVYVVPAFAGLGAPYWDMDARGMIVGITRGTNRNHIIRASLESIAFQTNDVIRAMEKDLSTEIKVLKVDGGASSNKFLMGFQADISDLTVSRPVVLEATALGAAFLAGLAIGFFKDREQIKCIIKEDISFNPSMSGEERNNRTNKWRAAVNACMAFK